MRDVPRSVIIFAAGFGTRMGRLTADRPKPMIEVAGRPLIDHALDEVRAAGLERVVVNLHYRGDAIRHHLDGSGVLFSEEQPNILDTGGGLRAALPLLGEGPVFTMNSDAVWFGPNPLRQLLSAWDPAGMDALLLCVESSRATGHGGPGDFSIGPDGTARRGRGVVYTGLQIIRTDGLREVSEAVFSLHRLWDGMLARGRLHAVNYSGQWCDVGRPAGIRLAEEMLQYRDV